jgi:uncharacterized cupin superfamily protein
VEGAYLSNVGAETWEPFDLGDGRILGEVHWLRSEDNGAGAFLHCGVWRVVGAEAPEPFSYEMSMNETIHVLEGEVHLQVEGGDMLVIREDDVASFRRGLVTTWTIVRTPFKEFFVLS